MNISAPESPKTSLFAQDWWLDAIAPGQWENLLEKEGFYFPIVLKQKAGIKAVTMPPLSPVLGPAQEGRKILHLAAQKLKSYPHCVYGFPPNITDMLPFIWSGFQIRVHYTQRLELSKPERLWDGFEPETRNLVRKAEKVFRVEQSEDWRTPYALASQSLQSKKRDLGISRESFERAALSCLERKSGRIFTAINQNGEPVASIFCASFEETAYYLLGGIDREKNPQGAMNLLIWEALKYFSTETKIKIFDFEGSMLPSIDQFFRSFGTTQIPYFVCFRSSRWLKLILAGRDFLFRVKQALKPGRFQ